jgi:energy-coupling factor transporter transmembrane protein EcfT
MASARIPSWGQYVPGTSPVHGLDPRAKLAACLLGTLSAFAAGGPWGFLWAWPLVALGVLLSGTRPSRYARALRPFGLIFAFLLLSHGWTPSSAPLGFSLPGLLRGACISGQLATVVTFSALLVRWGERVTPLGVSSRSLPPVEQTALEMVQAIRATQDPHGRSFEGLMGVKLVEAGAG